MRRFQRALRSPLMVPCLLAIGYLVLLVVRFPRLIAWDNADSDIASAYVLTDAIVHGHTGHVVMSTQGSWVPLWYGLITHGLSFHRVLWEISPALLTLGAALLIGWSVARLAGLAAGALSVALIVAASPTELFTLTGAFFHNTTLPGVALLGIYLTWVMSGRRTGRAAVATGAGIAIVTGLFVASDPLLAVIGLVPFAGVGLLMWLRTRDRTGLVAVGAVTIAGVAVALVTSAVMHSLDFSTTTPRLRFTTSQLADHAKWLVQGLLRLGNGLSVAPHSDARSPLVVAAAIATIAGLVAMYLVAGRFVVKPPHDAPDRARTVHVLFWAGSLLCAAVAYVVTTVVSAPTDRYLLIAPAAVAATVPVIARGRRVVSLLVAAGASVFIAASIVSLAANDERALVYQGATVPEAPAIEAFVHSHHLSAGYAGYWDAANLDWVTRSRLHVYPITNRFGPTEPMYLARVGTWYRPRPRTPSYLILAPNDADLPNRVPSDLPTPSREVRIGALTVVIYPYDIASRLHPPSHVPY